MKLYQMTCEYCGTKFETDRYWARFCKRSHKEMAYQNRKKEQQKSEAPKKNCK